MATTSRLQTFIGTWETEGQQYAGPFGPAGKVKATETYEWLTGGSFMVHRFEGSVADHPAASIEVIGPASNGKSVPVHAFYDSGVASEWKLEERGSTTWLLTGTWPIAGREAKVRCTLIDGGDTMTGRWEYVTEGGDWQASWDVKSVRKAPSALQP
jgi:hypothetical protein